LRGAARESDEAVVIDALAPGIDLKPFFELMANEKVLKVFHAARQDIEIVWHRANIIPHPIFDTQVAAMVLGHGDSISYDQLVQRITGDMLDKSNRFTDWTRRPLSTAQVTYAISDVTHLRESTRLWSPTPARRTDWMDDEMEVLLPDTYRAEPAAPDAAVTRVRKPKELAVLIEVAAWRERGRNPCDAALACPGTTPSAICHPGPDHRGAARVTALAAQGLRALEMGRRHSGGREGWPRPRSEILASDRAAQNGPQWRGDCRTAQGSVAHDLGAARCSGESNRHGR
jgi:hypothetical protein